MQRSRHGAPATVLVDLDGTLLDRDSAFATAVHRFCESEGLGRPDVDWVMSVDASGYAPRAQVAEALVSRYPQLAAKRSLVDELLAQGGAGYVVLEPRVERALRLLRDAGHGVVVVTNGPTEQQQMKLKVSGLDLLVDGCVISQAVGYAKPDPEIFELAVAVAGGRLPDVWMVGDSAEADMRGAHALGYRTAWVSRGRQWEASDFRPTTAHIETADALADIASRTVERTRPA